VREADRRVAGTGLGLAICRGLTEALGGAIEVREGPDGKGTCVEVRLPIEPELRPAGST
jgi:two-component system sensor histidine kinase KdpD